MNSNQNNQSHQNDPSKFSFQFSFSGNIEGINFSQNSTGSQFQRNTIGAALDRIFHNGDRNETRAQGGIANKLEDRTNDTRNRSNAGALNKSNDHNQDDKNRSKSGAAVKFEDHNQDDKKRSQNQQNQSNTKFEDRNQDDKKRSQNQQNQSNTKFDDKDDRTKSVSTKSNDRSDDKIKVVGSGTDQKDESKKTQNNSGNNGNKKDFNEDPNSPFHVSASKLDSVQGLDPKQVKSAGDLFKRLGDKGNVLDFGNKGGVNTGIGSAGDDLFRSNAQEAFNTVTGAGGKDLFVVGKESTTRVLDFDPKNDQIGLSNGLKPDDILFGQGTNPTNGGTNQPLDSKNDVVVIDRNGDHIIANIKFANVKDFSSKNFVTVNDNDIARLEKQLA